MVKHVYKHETKRYKGTKMLKFSDGSVSIYSPRRHKGASKIKMGKKTYFYTPVHRGGFRAAKRKVDRWEKP